MEKTRPPKQHDLATHIFWPQFRCVFTQPQITLELSPTPARNAAMSSGHARQQRIHPKQHVRHLKHRNWWRMYCWGDLKHWSIWACKNTYVGVIPPNPLNKIWSRMSRVSRKMVDENHPVELRMPSTLCDLGGIFTLSTLSGFCHKYETSLGWIPPTGPRGTSIYLHIYIHRSLHLSKFKVRIFQRSGLMNIQICSN